MGVERCDECGFDGSVWSDDAAVDAVDAVDAVGELPMRWRAAVAGLDATALQMRPFATMWSIGEYVDHVREVLFAMRFVLDSAIADPGVDLGQPPKPRFDATAREVDVAAALDRLEFEALSLQQRLRSLAATEWTASARVGDDEVDAHWIARHAVHDATHHLLDVHRLRTELQPRK